MEHKSVLKKEIIDLLKLENGKVYLDLTLGGGGHSLEILNKLENVTLIAFDLDANALESFKKLIVDSKKLREESITESCQLITDNNKKVYLVNENFENLDSVLSDLNIESVDGVIADLGWATDQLETLEGLSFEKADDILDMRFDARLGVRANDLLNALTRKQMKQMFENYSDIKGKENKYLVEDIVKQRNIKRFENVSDLLAITKNLGKSLESVSGNMNKFNARVFQALRIAVNNEYKNLNVMLEKAFSILNKNGRLEVIVFHSGEEKIVKDFLYKLSKEKKVNFISQQRNNNFIQASVDELMENIQSRSAKLYAVEKII